MINKITNTTYYNLELYNISKSHDYNIPLHNLEFKQKSLLDPRSIILSDPGQVTRSLRCGFTESVLWSSRLNTDNWFLLIDLKAHLIGDYLLLGG